MSIDFEYIHVKNKAITYPANNNRPGKYFIDPFAARKTALIFDFEEAKEIKNSKDLVNFTIKIESKFKNDIEKNDIISDIMSYIIEANIDIKSCYHKDKIILNFTEQKALDACYNLLFAKHVIENLFTLYSKKLNLKSFLQGHEVKSNPFKTIITHNKV